MTRSARRLPSRSSERRRRALTVPFVLVALGGCDSGPSGPGAVLARVTAPNLGAVVLEVEGAGIQGFAGRGDTRVYSAAVPGRTGVHRVILIDPVGGEITLEMQVDDVGMEGPIVTVVQAARADNASEAVRNLTVTVER
jgi:hypothetical protein